MKIPVIKEGLIYGAVLTFIGLIALNYSIFLCLVSYGVALLVFYFFRDPFRKIPLEDNIIVAPADGRVVEIENNVGNDFIGGNTKVVKILLSLCDVHINRSPIEGEVKYMKYTSGSKISVYDKRSDKVNERNTIGIKGDGINVEVTQIAGLIARRIVKWAKVGDRVSLGEKIGMIRFGSRTNITLPEKIEVCVNVGDRVKAGETVVGRIK